MEKCFVVVTERIYGSDIAIIKISQNLSKKAL